MLQRGEQRVELGQMGAVLGFELVDLGDAGGEGKLEIRGGRTEGLASCLDVVKPKLVAPLTAAARTEASLCVGSSEYSCSKMRLRHSLAS